MEIRCTLGLGTKKGREAEGGGKGCRLVAGSVVGGRTVVKTLEEKRFI